MPEIKVEEKLTFREMMSRVNKGKSVVLCTGPKDIRKEIQEIKSAVVAWPSNNIDRVIICQKIIATDKPIGCSIQDNAVVPSQLQGSLLTEPFLLCFQDGHFYLGDSPESGIGMSATNNVSVGRLLEKAKEVF